MCKHFIFRLSLLFLLAPSANFYLRAQSILADDFGGSTVTSQNAWQGNINHFQLNTGQLQLNAPTGGASSLVLPYTASDSLEFGAYIKMDFAPSATNTLQYWLMASSLDLTQADGYFLEIGENGNLDALHFKKRIAGQSTILASSVASTVANQPATVRFKAFYKTNGQWSISTDYTGGSSFMNEWTVTDTDIPATGTKHLGLYCLYTDTRKDKYFFDDIYITRQQPDTQPPLGVSANIIQAQQVRFELNEPVMLTGTVRADAFPPFQMTPNIELVTGTNAVIANFSTPLASGTNYTFRLLSLADTSGNIADTLEFTASFIQFSQPEPGDVIINEIFPDPSPSVGLGPDEFVEVFNRSNKHIRGEDLRWKDGTSQPVILSGLTLAPGQIHVLCAQSAVINFPQGIQITGINPFPTLNNDGETLTLLNSNGTIIDQIDYTLNWYRDAVKDDGGYTLERVNPTLPCSDANNWRASTNPLGGTPGAVNSVFDDTPDTTAPSLVSVTTSGTMQVRVVSSEPLDAQTATTPNLWQILPAQISVIAVTQGANLAEWILDLNQEIPTQVLFALSAPGVSDCSGFALNNSASFARTQAPQPQDVVVNEILFNPATGGSRFVELLNQSSQYISLKGCRLVGGTLGDVTVHTFSTLADVFPDSVFAFTPNVSDILNRFDPPYPQRVLTNTVPTLPDDEGVLILECPQGTDVQTIDSVSYTKAWHSPFLSSTDQEGVSLERIGPSLNSNSAQTWISSANPNGGTPGYRNSQYFQSSGAGSADQFITLSQVRLSPDGDGYEDYLPIEFRAEQPGYIGTVRIFDADGNLVQQIAKAALLGSETVFRWDGDNAEGEIVRPGIYLLFFEFVSPSGQRHRGKRAVTLVAKF